VEDLTATCRCWNCERALADSERQGPSFAWHGAPEIVRRMFIAVRYGGAPDLGIDVLPVPDTMKSIANLFKRRLSGVWTSRPQELSRDAQPPREKWRAITVSEREIDAGAYKKHLGGGEAQWDLRGAFQLFFLKRMGLAPGSRLLDIGCGPIRAGVHLIRYLDDGNYLGFDFNKDFIRTARKISEDEGLSAKNPRFEVVEDFRLGHMDPVFDYAIAFSVLNHCNEMQRKQFFQMISKPLRKGGLLYISHASWLRESHVTNTGFRLTRRFSEQDFNIREWGWPEPEQESVFPIIELTHG